MEVDVTTFWFESKVQFLDEVGEAALVPVRAEAAVHLPALGVLPVQVQAVEVVGEEEADDLLHEGGPAAAAVHQPAVLVPLRVVPAADGEQHLPLLTLQCSHLLVKI